MTDVILELIISPYAIKRIAFRQRDTTVIFNDYLTNNKKSVKTKQYEVILQGAYCPVPLRASVFLPSSWRNSIIV